ncbi:GMC family oxidoreductase N-terminal domain-containing protein [Gemmatimonas sp.]|uniref:GMC family oxidoreductase N-terminal domain-containing protein n=1 Tax=Gemmatimonas sp. TaxID=1962908 RepID=UPI003983093D
MTLATAVLSAIRTPPRVVLPHLSRAQRASLAALARCVLRGAPPSTETADEFVARCDARLELLPAHRRAQMGLALDVLAARTSALLAIGKPTRFAAQTAADQTRCFERWLNSPLAPLRSASHSVRRLLLAVHYARPEVSQAIGYAGPMHLRAPRVSWEGSMSGVSRVDEPVARGQVHLPSRIAPAPLPRGVIPAVAMRADGHRTADVVVIGTGAGGAVTAARLAEAGFDVIMLESGAYRTRADFDEREAELTEQLYADGALRTTDDASVALVQGNTVGGSTTVNWMIMLRTPEFVLDQWATESGVYGMTPREMGAVFERVEREVHASAVPADAHSANNRILLDGARSLGWKVSTAQINAVNCVRCGFCGVGCRHDAKQSTLVTYVPRALVAGATLYADTHVDRLEVRERDTGAGTPPLKRVHATVRDPYSGRPARALTIDAPIVVVAGGAIGTPALLQRSGLGGGGVGQWLRLHPTTAVWGRYDREIVASTGISLSTMCDEHLRWRGTDFGFWIETPPMHPSFTAAAMPGFGQSHGALMSSFNQLGVLIGLTRDGAERTRSSGRVRVNRRGETSIEYALTPEDQRRVRASLSATAELHFAAGAQEVGTMHSTPIVVRSAADVGRLEEGSVGPNRIGLFSAHVNGTCRMGTDPTTSGATPEGERHGVRGLYISDGSLLPTSLGVNPQETIMAIATVLAERMAMRHASVTRT